MIVYPSSRMQAERTIAAGRVFLAVSALFAVWLDPSEPARYATLTYTLYWVYVIYSAILAAGVWQWHGGARLPLVTHVVDIGLSSVFQYLTLGPSSPFFVYFVFSMFCGAIRWGWRGTLTTAGIVIVAYLVMTYSISRTLGASAFEVDRIIIRTVYLVVTAGMLVYLGRYESRLRSEIERLARWPSASGLSPDRVMSVIIEHAAHILGAERAVVVWEEEEEPTIHMASWSPNALALTKHSPGELTPLVPESLRRRTFFCAGELTESSTVLVNEDDGRVTEYAGLPLHKRVLALLQGSGLASAAFQTDRVSGRVLFSGLGVPSAEIYPLTEVVGREIGMLMDQMHLARQSQEIVAREERIRLARDLHDGVLQSLTGIRFELLAVAGPLAEPDAVLKARLFALERALAIEQRELRYFIDGLRPSSALGTAESLGAKLDKLRERLALEWTTPVTIRISPGSPECPPGLAQAVPLMVHEAVVNALKHAHPSRVNVNVSNDLDRLRIVVSDDGEGFPFKGRFDHGALERSKVAPRSLFDRVTAMGGKMSIDSSDEGSRVEIVVSL